MTRTIAFVCSAVLVVALLPLAGCGSGIRFVREDVTTYPAKGAEEPIEVREGGSLRPHVVIGTFTAERNMKASYGDGSSLDRIMDDLKKEARKVGADALVHVHPILSEEHRTEAKLEIVATAVRYLKATQTVGSGEGSR
jgi:hypothetical protein